MKAAGLFSSFAGLAIVTSAFVLLSPTAHGGLFAAAFSLLLLSTFLAHYTPSEGDRRQPQPATLTRRGQQSARYASSLFRWPSGLALVNTGFSVPLPQRGSFPVGFPMAASVTAALVYLVIGFGLQGCAGYPAHPAFRRRTA